MPFFQKSIINDVTFVTNNSQIFFIKLSAIAVSSYSGFDKNKKMNKKITLAIAVLAFTVPISAVLAEETSFSSSSSTSSSSSRSSVKVELKQKREDVRKFKEENRTVKTEVQEKRAENQLTKCQNVQARIQDRISKYDSNKLTFENAFINMQARLTRLSAKLASAGVDVSQLNADIATLGEKIAKLKTDRNAFASNLQEAATTAATNCDKTPNGGFMGKVLSARKGSELVRQDALDIRKYFQTVLRPEIMSIRAKLASQKATSTTNSTTETTSATDDAKTL